MMSCTFSAAERQQTKGALAQCTGSVLNGANYRSVEETDTKAVPFCTTQSNMLALKLDTLRASDSATLWLDVAIEAYGGMGMHSAVIRACTADQFSLRLDRWPSGDETQKASNVIGNDVEYQEEA